MIRLALDLATLALLLLAMAYWWLGNLAHEIIGTGMFALLARHLLRNRRWFGAIRKGRYDGPRRVRLVLNVALAVTMTVLLFTSLAISQNLFAVLPIPDYLSIREIHWFAGYWVIVIVGLHIGLHWHIVAGILRHRLPVLRTSAAAFGLRAAAAVIAVLGVESAMVLGIWPRLGFGYSLVMWDFNASTLPYFAHWLAIVALFATVSHLGVVVLSRTHIARS